VAGLARLPTEGLDYRSLSIKYKLLKPDVRVEVEKSAMHVERVANWGKAVSGVRARLQMGLKTKAVKKYKSNTHPNTSRKIKGSGETWGE
jgi:hypothetical protein